MILEEYKNTLINIVQMYYPASREELSPIVDYSINKRYKEVPARVENSYNKEIENTTLLALTDYIISREPILTANGVMFKKHSEVPNPLAVVIQQFLDARGIHKDQMFQFPKGSEDFERYNLYQLLDKQDANSCYGALGMFTSLIYDINVASSVTANGRMSVSSMTLFFESFLANSVKFGSLDQVMQFILNVKQEKPNRKFNDQEWLDKPVTAENCFAKIIWSCGFRWMPNESEMDIIWQTICNLSQENINRLYYKNNLYEFLLNSKISKMITDMMSKLEKPYNNPAKVPPEIKEDIELFTMLLEEYVYYGYMWIDRIDRCDNMIKDICMISDTDSTIISLDAWFRFANTLVDYDHLKIHRYPATSPIYEIEKDEFGDITNKEVLSPITMIDPDYDYDFQNDKLIELKHTIDPITTYPEDYVRYSIISIMCFVLDHLVNKYMENMCRNNHSWNGDRKCKIYSKTEFIFRRVLLHTAKKSYASIMEVQEGNIVPTDAALDIKGIASMAKSSMAKSTRDALKKIMYEDILNAPAIDQFRIIKDVAILEKKIYNSLMNGSKEYYKPLKIKALNTYDNPMRIQGIKASVAWNELKPKDDGLELINLEERNAIDVAKVNISKLTVEKLKDKYPEVYENALRLLEDETFKKSGIDAIAIPENVRVPDWLLEMLDFKDIINTNISGFTYESVGIMRMNRNSINYTNILKI